MKISGDYEERVYAGVLGKIIGVYLGRPFEAWTHERITAELGEIWYYVHARRDVPLHNHMLVVTDDDISGTFSFLRALPDYGNRHDLSAAQIGQTWLNYIIERRAVLWWGGLGNSTEHTAYLRLKSGIPAPRSGSIATNGKVVAEQIGAQIFIDGWAMVAPGDPELAADLARRAASVSHDGEAIYAAQIVAAMEALAFVEQDLMALLDAAVRLIPRDSVIFHLIENLREWHAAEPRDWRATRRKIEAEYGYDRYGGNCHVVPNHALVVHALLHGDDNLQKSLMIVNTCGWDTDCNSGNVGCLLGIKNGLAGLEAGPDWRGPVADRMYLPVAEGGRGITDALAETYHIANIGRALAGEAPVSPKDGARFHFSLPGSVQGFQSEESPISAGVLTIENAPGHSLKGRRSLALRYRHLTSGRLARAWTPTFIPPEAIAMPGYRLLASPTLYPGQTVVAALEADATNGVPVRCRLYLQHYGADDVLVTVQGTEALLAPGERIDLVWRVPQTGGQPIAAIGVEIQSDTRADGYIYLDYLSWHGVPEVKLGRPAEGGTMWRRAWIDGMDQWDHHWPEAYRPVQNEGTGLLIQGTQEWVDYRVSAAISVHLAAAAGLAARVGGMRRYYALLLCAGGKARLIKALDGETVLAEAEFPWALDTPYVFALQVQGSKIQGWIDGRRLFEVEDQDRTLVGGGVALVITEGRIAADEVVIEPAV